MAAQYKAYHQTEDFKAALARTKDSVAKGVPEDFAILGSSWRYQVDADELFEHIHGCPTCTPKRSRKQGG